MKSVSSARRAQVGRLPVLFVAGALCAVAASGVACGSKSQSGSPDGSADRPGLDVKFATDGRAPTVSVTVSPATANLSPGGTQQFSATVTGSNNAVTWSASGGTITADGLYTAPSNGGGYIIQATSVADPLGIGTAIVNVSGGGSVIEPFYDSAHPYVQVMTPMPNATYFAPATIRIWAHAPDLGNDAVKGYSPQVDFYLGTNMVGSVHLTDADRTDYYQVDATDVPAGSYEIYARSVLASGTVESIHIPVTVVDVGAHDGPTQDLTQDLVLSGSMDLEIIGTPTARALITSSNGSRIRSASDWSGHLTIRYADVIGLGAMDVAGIEVNASGSNAIEIVGSVFDRCGPLTLGVQDQVPITFQGNTLQPNILVPVNDEPDYAGSHPVMEVKGISSGQKLFQGNNIGMSFVRFDRATHWLVGGDTDAEGNVFIGVRAGMEIQQGQDITFRGNFSYHRYPFGWSQGQNLIFVGDNTGTALVEHNMFRGSSWMVQGLQGEFRYNLMIDNINHTFFRSDNALMHHNVLANVGYQRLYEPSGGVGTCTGSFYNNTVDAGGAMLQWTTVPFMAGTTPLDSVRNNVFTGFNYRTPVNFLDTGSVSSADYNCFYNPDATATITRYPIAGGAHDCGTDGVADPKFPPRSVPFPVGDGDIWLRRVTVSQILALYRTIYTPGAGSPLIDAGDPSDDAGGMRNTDMGAVGAGNPHPDDLFGRFGQ